MGVFIDLSGKTFGRLTALWPTGYQGNGKNRKILWLCFCECGSFSYPTTFALTGGNSKSCGCSRDASPLSFGNFAEYRIYRSAKCRCESISDVGYHNYGGRGIRFLFTSFPHFLAEVGRRPSKEHSLDRIDNDGDYAPGNVKWATYREQALNRRKVRCLGNYSDEAILVEVARRGYYLINADERHAITKGKP